MQHRIILILVFTSLNIFAQSSIISGIISDNESGKNIPFCNVVLFNQSDSIINGTIGNEEGSFSFQNVKYGKYYISIQSLTHEEFKSNLFEINTTSPTKTFNNIKLNSASIKTEEVTIQVERSAVKIEPAKKTFDVKATGADAGGTAVDVLNNLPSVDVDDAGTVSLRGNSNIRILIDGKPAGFTAEDITAVINQLPANSIETIEVITVPSAKYDPEGVGGIINIVLKKERKKGYQGSISVSCGTIDKVNSNVSFNWNKNKWNIRTSYSYTDGTYWSKRTSHGLYELTDSFTVFDNNRDVLKRKPNHNGNLSIGYKINKTTKISIDGSVKKMFFNELDSSEFKWNYNDEDYENNSRNGNKDGYRQSANAQFNLNSKFKNGNSITFLSRTNGVNTPRDNHFSEPYLLQKELKDFSANSFINQLDLQFPIQKAKNDSIKGKYLTIETGLKSANRNFNEDFIFYEFSPSLIQYREQEEFSNELNYGEKVYAAYGLLNLGNKNVQFSSGLRAEYSIIESKTKSQNFNKKLVNFFPSASIVKAFSETRSLSLSYSKRIKRPRGKQLNPIPSYSDPFSLFVGDADLVPEKSHMSEISYLNIGKKSVFNSTIFHQYRDDRLGRLSYTDSVGVSTVLWTNFNYHQTLGLELFLNHKFNKWFKINGSSTFYNTWVDGENFREGYSAVYFGYDLKTNLQFKLRKSTNITLTGDYNSKRIAVVGVVLPRYGSDLSVKQKLFNNKGSLSLRLTDVFRTRGFGIDVDTDGWLREVRYRYESQLLWVAFNYSFGQTKFDGKRKFKRVSPNDRSF